MSTLRYTSIPSTRPGARLNVLLCLPEGRPRAVLQMTHGMVEYIGRYEELARYLAGHGIAAVGHDHLGHGGSVASKEDYGYFGRPDGNRLLLEDIHAVTRWAKALPELAGLPWFLLGHSMGSFYARQYICEYGDELAGAILMGTGWQPRAAVLGGRALCHLLAAFKGWHYRSRLVNSLAFGSYNRSFEPARTPNDWLNRDANEVDRYRAEERCSFIFTLNGYDSLFTGLARLCRVAFATRSRGNPFLPAYAGQKFLPPGIPLGTKFSAEPRTRPCGLAHSQRQISLYVSRPSAMSAGRDSFDS